MRLFAQSMDGRKLNLNLVVMQCNDAILLLYAPRRRILYMVSIWVSRAVPPPGKEDRKTNSKRNLIRFCMKSLLATSQ